MFGRMFVARVVVAAALVSFGVRAQMDPNLLAGLKARSIGPAGMSGRIAAIDAVPGDPSLVYVGAATGGLWRSHNGGLTWTPVFDDQPVQAIGAVAIDPGNRDTVWVGTGEGNPRNSASVGKGMFRSRDGGTTWTHLGLEGSERIHRIALDPRDGEVACVAAMGPTWGTGAERGVFKTTDGGKGWRKVLFTDDSTGCADLVRDPRNPDKLFAAMWQHRRTPWSFTSGGAGSGLHVSWDGGETWRRLGPAEGLPKGELGRIGVAIAPSDPDIVYALVEADKNVLLRSNDGGRTFATVNKEANVAPRPFYYCDIRVDPQQPGRVYSLHSLVTVSDDGGKTFSTLVPFRDVHPDHQAMWIDPTDGRHLLLGNDGGVAESRDRGRTWRFVANLPVGQFYHLDVDMDVPYHVYGGMQDNGSWRGPSDVWENGGIRNHHWDEVGFGDGFRTLPHPDDSLRGYSMSQGGYLMRWHLRTGERKNIRPAPADDTELRFNWDAGLAQDPFAADTIYLGSQFVHRSTDRGDTWEVISADLTTNKPEWQQQAVSGGLTKDATGAEAFTTIVCIAPSSVARGVLWVGTDDGRVHVSRDGGGSWTSVEGNLKDLPAHTWISDIEPGRFDPAVAFVTCDDHRRSNWQPYVYRTADYGASWTSIATGELQGYAHVIRQDLVDQDLLFLGTEFGLWFTIDGGSHWTRFTAGIPQGVSVMGLAIHPRDHDLAVGTHGRAAYVIDDLAALRALEPDTATQPLQVFTSAPCRLHRTKQTGASRFPGHGEFAAPTRPYGAFVTFTIADPNLPHPDPDAERARRNARAAASNETPRAEAPSPGVSDDEASDKPVKATFEIQDGSGSVIRTFKRPVKQGINRVVWDLRRKGFKSPRRRDDERERDDDDDPRGVEVGAGEYTVVVRYKDRGASTTLTVLDDPSVEASAGDREAKVAALTRAGRLQEALAAALDRVNAIRSDLTAIEKKVAPPRGGAESAPAESTPNRELTDAIKALRGRLTDLEKRIWTPEGTKGITDDDHAMRALGAALGGLSSSSDRPTVAQLRYLELAEHKTRAVVTDLNALLATDLDACRKLAEAAGARLLADLKPVAVQ